MRAESIRGTIHRSHVHGTTPTYSERVTKTRTTQQQQCESPVHPHTCTQLTFFTRGQSITTAELCSTGIVTLRLYGALSAQCGSRRRLDRTMHLRIQPFVLSPNSRLSYSTLLRASITGSAPPHRPAGRAMSVIQYMRITQILKSQEQRSSYTFESLPAEVEMLKPEVCFKCTGRRFQRIRFKRNQT